MALGQIDMHRILTWYPDDQNPTSLIVDARKTTSPNGKIVRWEWGHYKRSDPAPNQPWHLNNRHSPVCEFTNIRPGARYYIVLNVTDEKGQTGRMTFTPTVPGSYSKPVVEAFLSGETFDK